MCKFGEVFDPMGCFGCKYYECHVVDDSMVRVFCTSEELQEPEEGGIME